MSSVRTTAINILSLLFGRLGYRFTTAIALIIIAHTVEQEAYGIFTTALAWSSATLSLNDLGLSTYVLKTASKKDSRNPEHFGNTLAVQLILSTTICIALTALGSIVFTPYIGLLFGIVSFGQLAYEFRKTFRAVFRSHQKLKSIALTEVSAGILFLILTIALTYTTASKETQLLYFAIAGVIAQLVNITILARNACALERPRLNIRILPQMISAAKHFFIYNIFLLLYFQIDQILISILRSPEAVAVYSAPAQLITVLLFIPLMVFQATSPLMFEWFDHAREKYTKLLELQWRYLLAISIPMGIGIYILASDILRLVYGTRFFDVASMSTATHILQLLAFFLMLRFSTVVLMNALMTSNHTAERMRYQILAVVANIALDLALIPLYGPIGAAISTLVVETCTLLLLLRIHYITQLSRPSLMITPSIQILCSSTIMTLSILLLHGRVPVIVLALLGAGVYFCALRLSGFFTPQDIALFKQLRKTSV